MIKFNTKYLYLAIFLFLIEALIAIFIDDNIIRPLVGDVLVIPLIYCFIKAFWPLRPAIAVLLVFGFACCIEGLQYLRFVNRIGLQDNLLLSTIIGTTFDWKDMLAYAVGTALVLAVEYRLAINKTA